MSFRILPLNFIPTLVITVDDLVQTPVIMRLKILVNDDLRAPDVLALDSPEVAGDLMRLHFSPFKFDYASFFEKRLTFVWAFNNFKRANLGQMELHLSSGDRCTAVIFALNLKLYTVFSNMLIHIVQRKHQPTF